MRRNVVSVFLFTLFILISFSELIVILAPKLGDIDRIVWLTGQLTVLCFAIVAFIKILIYLIKHRSWFVLSMFAYIFIYFACWNSIEYVHHETTQQIGCVVRRWYDPSTTIRSNCFIGYPSRQYYLPALPTLLFGRSISALRIGGMMYFLMGLSIFMLGWIQYFKNFKYRNYLSVFLLALIPHYYYVTERVLYAEQSHYPFSYGLMVVGILLLLKRQVNNLSCLSLLGLLLLQIVYIYTPGLALIPFVAIAYMLFFTTDKKLYISSHLIWIYIFLMTSIHLFFSLQFRHDVRILNHQPLLTSLSSDLLTSVTDLFHTRSEWIFLSPLISVGFLFTTVLFIIGFGGWHISVFAGWMVATMLAAISFQGYFLADIHFRVQRWMVILPVWMTCVGFSLAYVLTRSTHWKHHRRALTVMLLIMVGYGVLFQFIQSRRMSSTPPNELTYQVWSGLPHGLRARPISIYVDGRFLNEVGSMDDSLQYFFHESTVIRSDNSCRRSQGDSARIDVFVVPSNRSTLCNIEYGATPITILSKQYLVQGQFEAARVLIFSASEK